MANSSIEWTEMSWNPTTGCTKLSTGCKNCYAEVMTRRLKGMGQEKYKHGFNKVITHPDTLSVPYTWKSSKMIFVNSMSDLFHKDIPIEYIKSVFKVMNENPQHVFQVLTKRADRLSEIEEQLHWSHNIWMGVSVENQDVITRIDFLRTTSAKVKFISLEPLIGPLMTLNLENIDWVIVGGESGHNSRPIKKEWVSEIQLKCQINNVPFFFKQWGGQNKKVNGRLLNGKIYDEMPLVKELEKE